jgi:MFS family permease
MIKLRINKIIKFLLLSDLIFWSGWGLVAPIFAVFIVDRIESGDAFVVGVAAAIYSGLLALLRIPMGLYLDSRSSQKIDYAFTAGGLIIASMASFGFIYAALPWHIYVLQIFHAIGMAMNFSGFSGLFTRNIDKGRESTEQGIDSTVVNIGTAVAALTGGWLVVRFGYAIVFMLVGIMGLFGAAALLFIKNDLDKRNSRGLYFSFKELMQKGGD